MHNNTINVFSIFVTMWVVSIVCYLMHPVGFYSVDVRSVSILLMVFLASLVSYYFPYRLFSVYMPSLQLGCCLSSIVFSKTIRYLVCFFLILLYVFFLIYNQYHYGSAPLLVKIKGLISTYHYYDYGRGKNYLYYMPVILLLYLIFKGYLKLAVASLIVQSLICILYLSRGPMIVAWCYFLFGAYIRYKHLINFRYLVVAVIFGFIFLCLLMGMAGSIRTGNDQFLNAMAVVGRWRYMPIGFVWVVVYICAPLSNALDFISNGLHEPIFNSSHLLWRSLNLADPANTAVSYLGGFYLRFGVIGVFLINIIYGSLSGIYIKKYLCEVSFLSFSILVICCVSSLFVFFADMLITYNMIIILCLLLSFDALITTESDKNLLKDLSENDI